MTKYANICKIKLRVSDLLTMIQTCLSTFWTYKKYMQMHKNLGLL